MERLAAHVEEHVDVDRVLEIAREAPALEAALAAGRSTVAPSGASLAPPAAGSSPSGGPRIAVAWDDAFAFYYADNLALLRAHGAELVFFSPLEAAELPVCDGLYLGGGYPELHAAELSANVPLRRALAAALQAGLPAYAECGGLLYLCESLADLDGRTWPLVGAVPGHATMHERLQGMGYREGRLFADSLLGPAGAAVRGHEFHYSTCELENERHAPPTWWTGRRRATPPATSSPATSTCTSPGTRPCSSTGSSAAGRSPARHPRQTVPPLPEVSPHEHRPRHPRPRQPQPRRHRAVQRPGRAAAHTPRRAASCPRSWSSPSRAWPTPWARPSPPARTRSSSSPASSSTAMHIRRDIPEMLAGFATEHPGCCVPLRPAAGRGRAHRRDPAGARRGGVMPGLKPHEIEVRSMEIIDGLLPGGDWSPGERTVVKRLVHTSGDPSLATAVRFSAGAVDARRRRAARRRARCSPTRTWCASA